MAFADIETWNCQVLSIGNTPTSLRGIATEVSSPVLEIEYDTTKRAGEIGIVPRPKYFNEVEVSLTLMQISQGLLTAITEAGKQAITLVVSATVINDLGTQLYEMTVTGSCNKAFPGFSEDGTEMELVIMANRLDVTFGSFSFIYEPALGTYTVNGVPIAV